MNCLAALVICLALTGCGAARTQETKAVDPGAEVTLAPGMLVAVNGAGMTLRFVAVTEDSRCPRDVTCIWAGEVKAQIEIQESTKAAWQVEILEGGSAAAGAFRVTLVRIEPQPTSSARIAPQDYRATLKTDKARR